MYNFLLAFTVCGAAVIIGELVSSWTKAWVPSVFVTACLFLLGYWTVLPHDLIKDSYLIPFGGTICVMVMIVHLGTIISMKRLLEQWKTVVTCLLGLLGMCLAAFFICPFFMDRTLVIAGLPPLTGGIVAATMMQKAAMEAGLTVAALFAISMYCIQGFAGYPLTAFALKKESRRLLEGYRNGTLKASEADREAMQNAIELAAGGDNVKRLPLQVPEKYNSSIVILTKLGLVAWVASVIGKYTGVSGAIWALILGVIFCTFGFLDRDSLHKANSFNIMMLGLICFVFDGLKDMTPELLFGMIGPMIGFIIVGVAGMTLFAFVASKILHRSFFLCFANCLTALYGFPFDQIITDNTCKTVAKTREEYDFLMGKLFPSMIVGGFVTVTITSVFIAGIFVKMF